MQNNTNLAYSLTESLLNPLELLPLARGASWRYSYIYSYYYFSEPVGTLRINRYGRFHLSTKQEIAEYGRRAYLVETRLDLDCEYRQEDTFNTGKSNTRCRRMSSRALHELAIVGNALWYDNGDELELMLPLAFGQGTYTNLKLFDYPGTPDFPGRFNFFDYLLGPGRLNSGRYLYSATPPDPGSDQKTALFSASGQGPLSLRSHIERSGETVMIEDLSIDLLQYIPGRQAR